MSDIDFQNGFVVGMTLGAKFGGGPGGGEPGGEGLQVVELREFNILKPVSTELQMTVLTVLD